MPCQTSCMLTAEMTQGLNSLGREEHADLFARLFDAM